MSIPKGVYVAGNRAPRRIPVSITASALDGLRVQYTIVGLYDDVLAEFNAARKTAVFIDGECRRNEDGVIGVASIIEHNRADQVSYRLELDWAEQAGSILGSEYFSSISPSRFPVITGVANHLQTLDLTQKTFAAEKAAAMTKQSIASGSIEEEALDLLLMGQTDFTWDRPVITYTRSAPPGGSTTFSTMVVADNGTVWTTAELANYVGSRARNFIFATLQPINFGSVTNFSPGWRKRCRVGWSADGGVDLVETFTFGHYHDYVYIWKTP